MRQMEDLLEVFNRKENSTLLKCKLDYILRLYNDCRNSKYYSTISEIVENFSEIILILEKDKEQVTAIDSGDESDYDGLDFSNLEKLIKNQPISDQEIIDSFEDYMIKDSLFNRNRVPSEATIKDYIKRLKRYAREYATGITILELYRNIQTHVNNYSNSKENLERNKKQHGAELAALKKLNDMKAFINDTQRKEYLSINMGEYVRDNFTKKDRSEAYYNRNHLDIFAEKPHTMNFLIENKIGTHAEHIQNRTVTFSDALLKFIKKYREEHPEECKTVTKFCENVLHIDREQYYKMVGKSGSKLKNYMPTKSTVFKLAVGMGLSLDETNELLATAGYCISRSNELDLAMEYCILNHLSYDDVSQILEEINMKL